MADKAPFESLTGIAQQTADQITQQTKVAMENYLTRFHNAMSASQSGNVDLNRKLLSYATKNVTTAVGLVQKLGQAKNLEEVVKIQTDFISKQMVSMPRVRQTHHPCLRSLRQPSSPTRIARAHVRFQAEHT